MLTLLREHILRNLMKQPYKQQPRTCQGEMRQRHFPRQEDPAPHHGGRHLGAYQRERRSGGLRAEKGVVPVGRHSRPSPGSRSWCGPEQHGCRISHPEASPAAGTAVFRVFRGGRLMLHLLPQPSRRYRRPPSVKEGGMRHKGPLPPSGHHFGKITVFRLLTGLDQPSVPSPSGCAWVKWWPLAVMDARGPGNPGTAGLGS